MVRETILIEGMQGLGDNLHQRAALRVLMRHSDLLLKTPWPWVYHDLAGQSLRFICSNSRLRKQAENERREASQFIAPPAKPISKHIRIWYPPAEVKAKGSVLAAMLASCGLQPTEENIDFRLPVPSAWQTPLVREIKAKAHGRPILIYRPLVERPKDWAGCAVRNPDFCAYAQLFKTIRDRFFVVSLADLVDGVEWIVGEHVEADVTLHKGELECGALASLFTAASMVFASPGFAVILAQAVGTPVICTFGGYENASSFSIGAKLTPTLSIEPIHPCACFSHSHACRKAIDLPLARNRLLEFVDAVTTEDSARLA
jgi:hypothetical protein